MTRTIEEIDADIRDNEREKAALAQRLNELRAERGNTLVALSAEHPWAGKKVRRVYRAYYMSSPRTQRGIVAQNTSPHRLHGRQGHNPEPGEWYVRSAGGVTFYRLTGLLEGHAEPWELDI